MKIRVLDFETTGVDPKTCRPLECAAITYDTKTRERTDVFSTLIYSPLDLPISEEITELTGISDATMQEEETLSLGQFIDAFRPSLRKAEMLCAYNAPFDRGVLDQSFRKFEMSLPHAKIPWFDAMTEIPWPPRLMKCRKLQHRALDLGLPMDSRGKHRALSDVETVCDIMDLYDMEEVLSWAALPWVYILAIIPPPWEDNGRGRDLVKSMGFGWECALADERRFAKRWVARFKSGSEPEEFPFPTEIFL